MLLLVRGGGLAAHYMEAVDRRRYRGMVKRLCYIWGCCDEVFVVDDSGQWV